ncbi:MAG: ABC-F family ATP-binding cassette domain-containing protein [Anaerolineales bacterium]|nr:ABC-F family ATP-binding cassette domain-containing protein [Anaerolineales bacterium]
MQVLHMDHVKLNYGVRPIFTDLSWMLHSETRIGLVGPNGSGKSSILKLIAGVLEADAGSIIRARGVEIGYLPQDIDFPPNRTLIDIALELPPILAELETALAAIEDKLGDPAVYNDEGKLTRTLHQQEKLLEAYEAAGGPQFNSTVREILTHLGFTPDDYDLPAETLSGGQKKLVALTRLAATQPTVLLLDEPDNHLDIAAKRNLERFLNNYQGTVVLVSHDRYLLDEVVTEIAELENGTLTSYKGNYSAYKTARELARLRQQQLYVAQQKEIARIEAAIARFELWASMVVDERHIRQARSRRKLLERMEANGEIIEKVTERRQMDLQLNGWRGSTKAIELVGLTMGFGDDLIFLDLNYTLRHGERVALVGPNGAGKSVLFRLIMNEMEALEGEVRIGPSTRIGYYSQQHETLSAWWHRTPVELLRDLKPMSDDQAVAFLIKFIFSYEQVRQPIGTMSGGERSRLQLACLMLQEPNLLLLDEPTNNLDIASVEVLEQQLDDFNGAILVISHDRYFLDQVVDQVIELDNGSLMPYTGGYTDYEDQKNKKRQTT